MIGYEQALTFCQTDPEAAARLLSEFSRELEQLRAEIVTLKAENAVLRDKVQALEEKIAKDSHNSSKPPSTDGLKNRTEEPAEKERTLFGGQPGHAGRTLAMAPPDRIEPHRVERCECCGRSPANQPPDDIEKRQVHDLPPLPIDRHRASVRDEALLLRPHEQGGVPRRVNAPVQYGPGVKAAAVYLKNYQLLPYERTCEMLGDFFGCPMSEGTLANLIGECHKRLDEPVQQIKEQIAQAPVAHFDESGSRVEKKLWWLHTASTLNATCYVIHPKRGAEALEAIGILPDFGGRAIHDFWKPYFSYGCAHGLCNAHHLRELIFVHEQHHQDWANTMIDCLLDIKKAVALAKPTMDHLTKIQIRDFEVRYQNILNDGYAANPLSACPADAEKKRGRRKKPSPGTCSNDSTSTGRKPWLSCTTSAFPSTTTWPKGTSA